MNDNKTTSEAFNLLEELKVMADCSIRLRRIGEMRELIAESAANLLEQGKWYEHKLELKRLGVYARAEALAMALLSDKFKPKPREAEALTKFISGTACDCDKQVVVKLRDRLLASEEKNCR